MNTMVILCFALYHQALGAHERRRGEAEMAGKASECAAK